MRDKRIGCRDYVTGIGNGLRHFYTLQSSPRLVVAVRANLRGREHALQRQQRLSPKKLAEELSEGAQKVNTQTNAIGPRCVPTKEILL